MSIQAILPRALDANGNPAPGAKAWFYNTGTTTAQTVYSDTALSTAHTQPVVADSNGVFPQIFGVGSTALKVVLTDAAEVALPEGTIDPVPTSTISTSTAGSIPFTPTAGIAQTNVQDAIEEVFTDSLQNLVEDTSPQLGGPLDANSNQVRASKGADVASAAALTLGNDGNSFDITGTTSITSIATKGVGTMVTLHFDDVLTLTHHATDLILPTGANITTAAGDIAVFYEYAAGDWRCVSYTRADGTALAVTTHPAPDYTSAEQTITNASALNLAHGLAAKPSRVEAVLLCKTTEAGWAVDDEIALPSKDAVSSSVYNFILGWSATNVTVVTCASGVQVVNKSTGAASALTNSNWRIVVRAWA